MRRLIIAGAAMALAFLVAAPSGAGENRPQRKRGADMAQVQKRRAVRERVVQHRFQKLDRDSSGAVSRQEWPRRPKVFDRLDTNSDGQLSPAELGQRRLRAHRRK